MRFGVYYYKWYSGQWLHRTPYGFDPPILGEYDNVHDTRIVTNHAQMMAKAGISFAAISWGGESHEETVDIFGQEGLKSCFLYESLIRTGRKRVGLESLDVILRDMEVIKTDMANSNWLRIDGKPVLILYVTRAYADAHKIIEAIRHALGDVFLVGDELFWGPIHEAKLKLFDAVTAYNFYQAKRFSPANPCETFNQAMGAMMDVHASTCGTAGVQLWPLAMPGYDDSQYRPESQHPPIPRMSGTFFADQLKMARYWASDGTLMMTSFNEHYEGTSLESMMSYGDKYLKMIRG